MSTQNDVSKMSDAERFTHNILSDGDLNVYELVLHEAGVVMKHYKWGGLNMYVAHNGVTFEDYAIIGKYDNYNDALDFMRNYVVWNFSLLEAYKVDKSKVGKSFDAKFPSVTEFFDSVNKITDQYRRDNNIIPL